MTGLGSDFVAITSYFNLRGCSRRLANYHQFRRSLPLPLLTVEWHPERRFELHTGDAEVLLQIGGGDPMWQKERLLMLAARALPEHVKAIAWIDCDVLFENPAWVDEARALLREKLVVQLFDEVSFPGERSVRTGRGSNGVAIAAPRRRSFLGIFRGSNEEMAEFDLARRFEPDEALEYDIMGRPASGFAWAARSDFFQRVGLYDRCIVGGGDLLFCYGIMGLADKLIANHESVGWGFYGDCPSYRQWAAMATSACGNRLGCVQGSIQHLYHGSLRDRQYRSRIDGLVPFGLDLDKDIIAADGEPWRWRRDRQPLSEYFLGYMANRNEDEALVTAPEKFAFR